LPGVPVVILGAGPAGLGAAWQLARRGFNVTVLERASAPGGNAGSFEIEGLMADYGSHRLHPACPPEILDDVRGMLGPDLLDRPRHGRIRLHGRWLHFPLKPANLVRNAPPRFLLGVLRDNAWKAKTAMGGESFRTVLEAGLGKTICRDFYFPYARKIWGVEPEELHAEQARRRVSAGSAGKMVRKLLRRTGGARFYYPRGGFGRISDAYLDAARQAGARVLCNTSVGGVEVASGRVIAVRASGGQRFEARHILSTIPLPTLIRSLDPPGPVLKAANALDYRAMILIYLVLETDRFTEFDAHYFPEAWIPITRLSEPKNYGLQEAPGATVLCAELPCSTSDAFWCASDDLLAGMILGALGQAGLPVLAPVRKVLTRRLEQAYPIYRSGYAEHFDTLDRWLGGLEGLTTLGRQGLFAHDNTHHTLAMAYAASRCLRDDGSFDRRRWAAHRKEFQQHVVED